MKIILYNVKDSNNTVNKEKGEGVEYTIKFKDTADITDPIIKLKSEKKLLFNYAYIEDFKRFYFINRIEIQPNDIYTLYLSVDVLESFKDDILQCSGFIRKKEDSNPYYNQEYEVEERKEIDIYKGDTPLNRERNIILVTTGGGNQ